MRQRQDIGSIRAMGSHGNNRFVSMGTIVL
jgi:hypothetical protein